ncbi:MAG TPA: acetate--CoA ligase family protein [bacterium]|nr:acetate--CoA ligase family protein [bacterium]
MDRLFYPDSVAVVGVSERSTNLGRTVVSNMLKWKFKGSIYCVGPGGGTVFGHTIYSSLKNVPGDIDVAVILSPAGTVPDIIDQAAEKGIEYLSIETAGFSELSGDGRRLGRVITEKASEYGIKFVGPNGLGIINAENGVYFPFSFVSPWEPGPVSIMAQSGGVGLSVLVALQTHNIAANKFISMGNKYSLDEVDYLKYLIDDRATKIILAYLEGISRGREFVETASKSKKPIILFKSNTTNAGAERALSHTAALANDEAILDAAVKQAGIVKVNSIEDLIDYCITFLQPEMKGRNVSIISPAGGFVVISADAAEKKGFRFPPLARETEEAIIEKLRAGVIKISNPLDLGDGLATDTQLLAVDKMLSQSDVDGMFYFTTRRPAGDYQGALKTLIRNPVPEIEKLVNKHNKPVSCALISTPEVVTEFRNDAKIPVYGSIELAVRSMAAYRDYCMKSGRMEIKRSEGIRDINQIALGCEQGIITGKKAFEMISLSGIPVADYGEAADIGEAVSIAERIGYPVALKVVSKELVHKSDAGGVKLNITSESRLEKEFAGLKLLADSCADSRILVQKMAEKGIEIIIGGKRDPAFGPVVMLGTGGVFVEVFRDIVFNLAPLTRESAMRMIDSLSGKRLLEGYRGAPQADINALADAVVAAGELAVSSPRIKGFDINPLIIKEKGKGCIAVDARFIMD